jgi:hypothetical protein
MGTPFHDEQRREGAFRSCNRACSRLTWEVTSAEAKEWAVYGSCAAFQAVNWGFQVYARSGLITALRKAPLSAALPPSHQIAPFFTVQSAWAPQRSRAAVWPSVG